MTLRCLNLHRAHTEDYHMGSRVLGGETRRVLTLLFLLPCCTRRSNVKKEKGRQRGGGRVEGDVRLSGWMGKMPCVNAIVFARACDLSLMAFVFVCVCVAAGMNMSPVSRLKKTWSKVKTAKFDILEVSLYKRDLLWPALRKWVFYNLTFNNSTLKFFPRVVAVLW